LNDERDAIRCAEINPVEQPFDGAICPASVEGQTCHSINECSCSNNVCEDEDVIPRCRRQGCPSGAPNGACRQEVSQWFCTADNLPPRQGCVPAQKSGLDNCNIFTNPYQTEEVSDAARCPAGFNRCFRYTLNPAYSNCLRQCREYSDNYEETVKRKSCCERNICSELNENGESNCNKESCALRIKNDCDSVSMLDCNWATKNFTDWVTAEAKTYFKEIDPSFSYKFVARSKEDILIDWYISCQREPATLRTDKLFFTLIKVLEEETGKAPKVVHEGVIHQRGFQVNFDIHAVTFAKSEQLKMGKRYAVRVYYFVPQQPGENLKMKINAMQVIVHRNRE
jgi:hypothetical protein